MLNKLTGRLDKLSENLHKENKARENNQSELEYNN